MHVIFCCSTTLDSAESLHQGGKAPLQTLPPLHGCSLAPLFPVQRQVDRKGSPRFAESEPRGPSIRIPICQSALPVSGNGNSLIHE